MLDLRYYACFMSVNAPETITIIFQTIVASCAVITAYVQVKNSLINKKHQT